ncbi:MAG TPA: ADP-forming succinate--CoA ligase subunit beta [Acidimicrobiales bacterium]|nr:ADP-forming succinate--CoA ligase subunit beta [Acidimicrobiales bacterium]
MDLFEHQGKELLASFGVPVPAGEAASTVAEAAAAAGRLGYPVVVKAQVRVGGRGKAGGIRVANDAAEVIAAADAILGMDIRGHTVECLWLEQASAIAAEHYVSFTLDRSARMHLGLLSVQGGVDIEAVAAENPAAVPRLQIDPVDGLTAGRCRQWVADAGLADDIADAAVGLLSSLWTAYAEGDAELVEVNPLVLTTTGELVALDAKVTLDQSAAHRHPEWEAYLATQAGDEREQAARARGLQYVGLDGTVGIIANGAGLAMSTLDVVAQVGGTPANFLDIGGGAKAEVMTAALEVVNADPKVAAIFVNIFGGITRGEEVATGIVTALEQVELASPIVVRLDGTNAAEGREILAAHESERLVSRTTMVDAAHTAVALAAQRSTTP